MIFCLYLYTSFTTEENLVFAVGAGFLFQSPLWPFPYYPDFVEICSCDRLVFATGPNTEDTGPVSSSWCKASLLTAQLVMA